MRAMGLVAAATLGLAMAVVPAVGASAAPCDAYPESTIDWDAGSSAQTLMYGVPWNLTATANGTYGALGPWTADVTMGNAPSGYVPGNNYYPSDTCQGYLIVYPPESRPLVAGTYSFTSNLYYNSAILEDTTPTATLTIQPGQITVTTAATQDPSNPRNVIVTAQMTGDWVTMYRDYWGSSSYGGSPYTPAGTWSIAVEDAEGSVVHEATFDRGAEDTAFGVSSFWPDAPAGEYTLRAGFTVTGSTASVFTITNPSPAKITVTGPAPGDAPTASPAPSAPPDVTSSGTTLPLWIPVLSGVIAIALLALLIIQIVRTIRRGRPVAPAGPAATGEVAT